MDSTSRQTFDPRDHPALMHHFEDIGFDPYASSVPVPIYPPSVATVAARYRAFLARESDRREKADPAYSALLDQMTVEFRDSAQFPTPQTL